ncbi:MAG: SbmA/BacA-like family transporter [Alphaproteobacteria bacterium]
MPINGTPDTHQPPDNSAAEAVCELTTQEKEDAEVQRKKSLKRAFVNGFAALAVPFWSRKHKWRNRGLTASLFVLCGLQVLVQIKLNQWSPHFINALLQHSPGKFVPLAKEFFVITASSVGINIAHLAARRFLQLEFRECLTRNLIDKWEKAGWKADKITNPDGRIADDILKVANGWDLASSAIYCATLGTGFGVVLWNLSGWIPVHLGKMAISIPGHLDIIAGAYAVGYAGLAFMVGKSMINATHRRQSKEQTFRFGLGQLRQLGSKYILGQDKKVEQKQQMMQSLTDIRSPWKAQMRSEMKILAFGTVNGLVANPMPLFVTYATSLAQKITFGTIWQAASAFQQFASACSWPVDNLAAIAEWRASAARVTALHNALKEPDAQSTLLLAAPAPPEAKGSSTMSNTPQP